MMIDSRRDQFDTLFFGLNKIFITTVKGIGKD